MAAALSEKDFTLKAEPGEYVVRGAPIDASIERVLNEVRLALLGVLLSIGLAVGFGVGGWCGLAWGVGTTVAAAVALRSRRVQGWLARLMHWVLGR